MDVNTEAILGAVERLVTNKKMRHVDYLLIGQVLQIAQKRKVLDILFSAQMKAVEKKGGS